MSVCNFVYSRDLGAQLRMGASLLDNRGVVHRFSNLGQIVRNRYICVVREDRNVDPEGAGGGSEGEAAGGDPEGEVVAVSGQGEVVVDREKEVVVAAGPTS